MDVTFFAYVVLCFFCSLSSGVGSSGGLRQPFFLEGGVVFGFGVGGGLQSAFVRAFNPILSPSNGSVRVFEGTRTGPVSVPPALGPPFVY